MSDDSGWNFLVDFQTRGVAFLNRPDFFGKYTLHCISIKTDHTAVIIPVGTKLKPVRQMVRIRDCRKHQKDALFMELESETW